MIKIRYICLVFLCLHWNKNPRMLHFDTLQMNLNWDFFFEQCIWCLHISLYGTSVLLGSWLFWFNFGEQQLWSKASSYQSLRHCLHGHSVYDHYRMTDKGSNGIKLCHSSVGHLAIKQDFETKIVLLIFSLISLII